MNRHLSKLIKKSFSFSTKPSQNYTMPHPNWNKPELEQVSLEHKTAITFGDHFAYYFIQSMRLGFDVMSGYKRILPFQSEIVSEKKWINRVLFLETVAGLECIDILRSLRGMKRDQGWIHTLLEEAENERIHLLTFLNIKKPSLLFRTGVVLAQTWYVALFGVTYMFCPRVCHRIVGYLEEEAVKTYTHMIHEIERDGSPIHSWTTRKANHHSIEYWALEEDATLLDVVKAIRKDEEHHKDVNHYFADDYTQSKPNPFPPGK
ncbi:unnamed protein product [Paramecium octaurelia]|uniref:Alternative oxidase n=1 Tax=Paramecium octaurelia TaxID=43137 RepID=A0A8S1S770_PAROT|nr:unnamed protein product [Paramecium octaurelia]